MAEKTLREHLAEARRTRWAKQTPEQRKEHSAKMNKARSEKYPPKSKEQGPAPSPSASE